MPSPSGPRRRRDGSIAHTADSAVDNPVVKAMPAMPHIRSIVSDADSWAPADLAGLVSSSYRNLLPGIPGARNKNAPNRAAGDSAPSYENRRAANHHAIFSIGSRFDRRNQFSRGPLTARVVFEVGLRLNQRNPLIWKVADLRDRYSRQRSPFCGDWFCAQPNLVNGGRA